MNQERIRNYLTPGHPTYLAGLSQLKRQYPDTALRELRQFLSNIDTYTLHRETKRPRSYNPIYVRRRNELWQADLADVTRLAGANQGIRYLLTVIDTFSRRAWAEPLKTKDAASVWQAFRRVVGKRRPRRLLTDRGREFTNIIFLRGLKRLNIDPVHLHSEQKAAHVERFNRTLKRLLYGYVTQAQDKTYLQALPQLLKTYNQRYHRTIKMSPQEADQEKNRVQVLANLAPLYWRPRQTPTMAPHDLVRIKRLGHAFHRGFDETFSRHIYRIHRVNQRKPRPTYFLTTMEGEPVEGGFYQEELQPVQFNEVFKLNKILEETKDRVLVSWKGWGPQYNTWVQKDDVPLLSGQKVSAPPSDD